MRSRLREGPGPAAQRLHGRCDDGLLDVQLGRPACPRRSDQLRERPSCPTLRSAVGTDRLWARGAGDDGERARTSPPPPLRRRCPRPLRLGPRPDARGRPSADRGVDAQLSTQLRELGFTGRIESTLDRAARPAARPAAGGHGQDALVRHDHRPERRQHLRRLPFADERVRRHAVDRDRDRLERDRRTEPSRPPQPAAGADGAQHRVLPEPDVERPLLVALGRPVRSKRGIPLPGARKERRSRTCRICSTRRRSSRRPSASEAAGFAFPGDNDAIRAEVVRRLNAAPEYRTLFARVFPRGASGRRRSRYEMVARAIAEFEFSLTFANAPIDRYARGELDALTEQEKQGALLFFGEAGCVQCHQVSGASNEMFSDFREHVIGVPQLVPARDQRALRRARRERGLRPGTVHRQSRRPLRVPHFAAAQRRAAAGVHARRRVHEPRGCDPASPRRRRLGAHLHAGGAGPRRGPERARSRHSSRFCRASTRSSRRRRTLTEQQLDALVAFVGNGLLDPRARPENLRRLVPQKLPSGRPPLTFEFAKRSHSEFMRTTADSGGDVTARSTTEPAGRLRTRIACLCASQSGSAFKSAPETAQTIDCRQPRSAPTPRRPAWRA